MFTIDKMKITPEIIESYVEFKAIRSGGPGGQHVNKVSTCVEAVLRLEHCSLLTEVQKQRIRTCLAGRLNQAGDLRVVCQESRSQFHNKQRALERLCGLIRQALYRPPVRIQTRPGRAVIERRLTAKKKRADIKRQRGSWRKQIDE